MNADGRLEVAFATNTGAVYLVDGSTGHDLPGFPFRTRGRIMAPVLLTRALPATLGLQAVVPSSDGHLYVIDAATGKPQLHDCVTLGLRCLTMMCKRCRIRTALLYCLYGTGLACQACSMGEGPVCTKIKYIAWLLLMGQRSCLVSMHACSDASGHAAMLLALSLRSVCSRIQSWRSLMLCSGSLCTSALY